MTPSHAILTVLGLALTAGTLPLVLELLILSLAAALPPRHARTVVAEQALRLFVLIPAHNEQALISNCVQSLRAAAGAQSNEIWVIAHNCTDRTGELAAAAGASVLPLNDGISGKGGALHAGFSHALARGAQAVLVIDADSTISPNLLSVVSHSLAAGSEAIQCRYEVANAGASPRTRLMALAFLGMNILRPRGRARLGLSCGIFGNGFALSAETLHRVPYVANSVVEDLEYHLLLLRAGIRVNFLDEAAVFGEMPSTEEGASTQRARWEGGRILMRQQWTGPLLADVLLRGRLRLLEPLLDLLSLPLATSAMLLAVSPFLPLAWLRVYAGLGVLTLALYILVAASLGPEPTQTLKALASVPGYLFWKLALIRLTRLAARREAAWVRTRRNAEAPASTEKL